MSMKISGVVFVGKLLEVDNWGNRTAEKPIGMPQAADSTKTAQVEIIWCREKEKKII